ncbi:MAG: YbbR-like domain-containing protein [Bacteroidales bacterium]|nr:YbbR-like domain-containing protein [Bacteroidales bacterium]
MPNKIRFRLLDRLQISGRDLAGFLLCLLLAFSIWLVHNLTLRYSAIMNVEVIAQSDIQGRSAESSNTAVISARCRASGFRVLRNGRNADTGVKVYFQAEEFTHGDDDAFYLSPNALASHVTEIFGEEVQLESFITNTVVFRFPAEDYRKVPVTPRLIATYRPQYTAVGSMEFSPDSVLVYGDPNYLENVDRVFTKPLELKNLKNDTHGEVDLDIPSGLRASATRVGYSLQVSRYVEISREVRMEVRGLPAGKSLSVYPSTAQVVFKCIFPMNSDPMRTASFYIDYEEFANSINGRCVARSSGLPSTVIDYQVEPQIFECVEE